MWTDLLRHSCDINKTLSLMHGPKTWLSFVILFFRPVRRAVRFESPKLTSELTLNTACLFLFAFIYFNILLQYALSSSASSRLVCNIRNSVELTVTTRGLSGFQVLWSGALCRQRGGTYSAAWCDSKTEEFHNGGRLQILYFTGFL